MIKKIILFIVSIFFLLNFTFAKSVIDWSLVQPIINLINFIWIPFIVLAGKLYTNWLVYWANLHLDAVLFHIWEFSKNVSNFIIWFILIWAIFWIFVWKTKNIFSILWKLAIATILINMSWFIIWVLIDISTILLSAVWNFPISMLWNNSIQWLQKVDYCTHFNISSDAQIKSFKDMDNLVSCEEGKKKKESPKSFFEKTNNISWPLFFIWASILNIDKSFWISSNKVKKDKNVVEVVSISAIVHIIILILFIVPVILLIIIWIVRIFYIWIYISFSPLIFLDQMFWWKVSKWNKAFKFSNMIWLIFVPVVVTFAMWISVIVLTFLQASFIWWKTDTAKRALGISWNSMQIWWKTVVTINWNLMNKQTDKEWWFLWELILIIMSSILLWSMIRLSFKSSEITSDISESIYKFSSDALKTIPILPIWKQGTSLWALEMWFNKSLTVKWFNTKASEQAGGVIAKIKKDLWYSWWDILPTDVPYWVNKIEAIKGSKYMNIFPILSEFIKHVKEHNPNLVPFYSPNFQKVIASAINKIWDKNKNVYEVLWLKKDNGYITDPKEMFNKSNFQRFVVWIIQNPDKLNSISNQSIHSIYSSITKNATASFINKKISNM